MTVIITDFNEKRLEKQKKFERKILKELSLQRLRKKIEEEFSPYKQAIHDFEKVEGGVIDVSIESFLLGAEMGKFGYYGESIDDARKRCEDAKNSLYIYLYDYLAYWASGSIQHLSLESLFSTCNRYVSFWWEEGYKTSEKRYKLRLH